MNASMPETSTSLAAGPPFRCPICRLPYWIERTCTGRHDHATGNFIWHDEVTAVATGDPR